MLGILSFWGIKYFKSVVVRIDNVSLFDECVLVGSVVIVVATLFEICRGVTFYVSNF